MGTSSGIGRTQQGARARERRVSTMKDQQARRRARRYRAFTVIEVLVVIGIISVLMAILVPAAERVRHQAYIDKCASNLRQIGLALQSYAQDNHGNYPRTIHDPTYANPLVEGTGVNAADPFAGGAGGVQPNDLTAPLFLLM